jgi:hypothetical protein
MIKFFLIIITIIFCGCQSSDLDLNKKWSDITLQQILSSRKGLLERIALQDIRTFNNVPKDSLVVHFKSGDFCGNSPIERLDGSPLFNDLRRKALAFGFKTIIKDTTTDIWMIGQSAYRNLPHYNLEISANGKTVHIMQSYLYTLSNQKFVETIKDTVIEL